jgi:L-threonylcarbamoyladenylate synthase
MITQNVQNAATALKNGQIVAIPTETVYGLAACITNPAAIESIFKTKERPFFDPLIVHVSSIEMAKTLTSDWNKIADSLAKAFWPGPLTIVLEKSDLINPMITAGLTQVGIRHPLHALTQELIELTGPLAAPSANKFKKTSPTTTKHVQEQFSDLLILEGGDCKVGIESTVIGIDKNSVLIYRPGMITKTDIEKNLMQNQLANIKVSLSPSPVAPGQLKHHYMPELPLIVASTEMSPSEIDQIINCNQEEIEEISLNTNPTIAARELYQKLRVTNPKAKYILLKLPIDILNEEKWEGILNRLEKAATYNLMKEQTK